MLKLLATTALCLGMMAAAPAFAQTTTDPAPAAPTGAERVHARRAGACPRTHSASGHPLGAIGPRPIIPAMYSSSSVDASCRRSADQRDARP